MSAWTGRLEQEKFLAGYIECALWSSYDSADDSGGEPLDANYDESDLSETCLVSFREDCAQFLAANAEDLADIELEQAGHDFWLTRNGHGAGFWDRGLGALGERLTKAAHAYGSVDLYVHEGQVHSS